MFKHIVINRLKCLIREKSLIFWSLIFPIVLATLFNFAFANLNNLNKFEPIDIAIVETNNFQENENFKLMMDSLTKEDSQIFKIKYLDAKKAKELLKNNQLKAYILLDKEIELVINSNGYNQTIVKSILDNYLENSSAIETLHEIKPAEIRELLLSNIEFNGNYIKEVTTSNHDSSVIYFYSLIGMVCLYAGFFGIQTIIKTEANLSPLGLRNSLSPVSKFKILFYSLIVDLLVQVFIMFILIMYISLLGISFGNQFGYIISIAVIGSLCGICLGILIGVSNKRSEDWKISILVISTMILSFLSGLMVVDIKHIVAKNMPLLAKINPVNLITDGLYSLYYYDTYERYYNNIALLLIFAIVTITISYFFIRRKKYASI